MEGKRGRQKVRQSYLGSKEKAPGLIRKQNKSLIYRLFV